MAEQITVETRMHVPAEKAWDYFTRPEHIIGWNFASDDWHSPKATNDLRVGGKYSARMESKDGSQGFDFEAIYDEVKQNELLAYHMSDGRKVCIEFIKESDGTRVVETFDAENENPLEMQRAGWQTILDNYKKYTESH